MLSGAAGSRLDRNGTAIVGLLCGAAVAFSAAFTTLPASIRVALLAAAFSAALFVRFGSPLAILIALIVSGTAGRAGAHVSVAGIPMLELLLAGGASLAVLTTFAGRRPLTPLVLMWLPAAVWAALLLVMHRPGSLESGIRELAPFLYPLLVACCFAAWDSERLRNTLIRTLPWIVVLGVVTTCIGVFNQLAGNATLTSSGQLRALSGTFAPSCAAGLIAAVVLIDLKAVRRIDLWLMAGAFSAAGLLLINHRSAFLAGILAAVAMIALRSGRSGASSKSTQLTPRLAVAGLVFALILAVTPFGQASMARFAETGNTADANTRDRIELTQRFMPHTASEWTIGKGIGLLPAGLARAENDPEFRGVHNSYVFVVGRSGLIGGVLLFVPVLVVLALGVRRRADPLIRGLTVSALFTAVLAAFNVTLENLYFSIWLWAPLIAIAAIVHQSSPRFTGHAP